MSDSCDSMDCIAPGSSVYVCYWNQLRFLKQRSLSGSRQKGSLSSCVAGGVFIWVICLEVNDSLKWMPWQSKLKSDICFKKKKKRQKTKKKKKKSTHYICCLNIWWYSIPCHIIIGITYLDQHLISPYFLKWWLILLCFFKVRCECKLPLESKIYGPNGEGTFIGGIQLFTLLFLCLIIHRIACWYRDGIESKKLGTLSQNKKDTGLGKLLVLQWNFQEQQIKIGIYAMQFEDHLSLKHNLAYINW